MKKLSECTVYIGLGLLLAWFCSTRWPLPWQTVALAGCSFLLAFLTYYAVKRGH